MEKIIKAAKALVEVVERYVIQRASRTELLNAKNQLRKSIEDHETKM